MSMSDPIASMLTCIRNACAVKKKSVTVPMSALKTDIVSVMQAEGYIESYKINGEDCKKSLTIALKYYEDKSVIETLKRISKPSLRIYTGKDNMPSVMNDLGIVIVSTHKGVMTGRSAVSLNIGGEVLCSVS